jgi:hypothetical protein
MWKLILVLLSLAGLGAAMTPSGPTWIVVNQFVYRGFDVAILHAGVRVVDDGAGLAYVFVAGPEGEEIEADPAAAKAYATAAEAEAAARESIDLRLKLPQPGMEGSGEPGLEEGPLAGATLGKFTAKKCDITRIDGPFRVCLSQNAAGKWSYKATRAGEDVENAQGAGFDDRDDALVASWEALLPYAVTYDVRTRDGVTLQYSGIVSLQNSVTFAAKAQPIIATQLAEGDDDGASLVLAVLGAIFPAVNLLRLRPNGDELEAVAERVDAASNAAAKVAAIFASPPVLLQLGAGAGTSVERYTKDGGSVWTIVYTATQPELAEGQAGFVSTKWRAWAPGVSPQEGTETLHGSALTAEAVKAEAHQAIDVYGAWNPFPVEVPPPGGG